MLDVSSALLVCVERYDGLGVERQFILVVLFVDADSRACGNVAVDDEFGDAVLDVVLDGTFQRTGTKLDVVALLGYELLGLVAQFDGVAQVADALVEA